MQRRGSEEKKRVNLTDVRAYLCHSASSSFKCHLKKTSLTSHCGKNNQVFRKDPNNYIFWSLDIEVIYLHFIYIYLQNV